MPGSPWDGHGPPAGTTGKGSPTGRGTTWRGFSTGLDRRLPDATDMCGAVASRHQIAHASRPRGAVLPGSRQNEAEITARRERWQQLFPLFLGNFLDLDPTCTFR